MCNSSSNMYNEFEYQPTNITGAATTDVFTGKGTFHSLVINSSGSGGTVTITDNGSPVVNIALITLSGSPFVTLFYDASISAGLRIVTSASPNITALWRKG